MAGCCSQSPLNIVNECFIWCEIPEYRIYKTGGKSQSTFSECFWKNYEKDCNETVALRIMPNSAGSSSAGSSVVSVKALTWGVAAAALLALTV